MDRKVVKHVTNGVNFVKIGHFGENGQYCVIWAYFWGQNAVICQIFWNLEYFSNNFVPKGV